MKIAVLGVVAPVVPQTAVAVVEAVAVAAQPLVLAFVASFVLASAPFAPSEHTGHTGQIGHTVRIAPSVAAGAVVVGAVRTVPYAVVATSVAAVVQHVVMPVAAAAAAVAAGAALCGRGL